MTLGPLTALLAGLFMPLTLTGWQRALLLVPLCLSIAVVYKSLRLQHVRDIPATSAVLCVTLVVGMYAVGVGVWLLFVILA